MLVMSYDRTSSSVNVWIPMGRVTRRATIHTMIICLGYFSMKSASFA